MVLCGAAEWVSEVEAEVRSALPLARCVVLAGGEGGIAPRYQDGVLQVLQMLQGMVQDKPRDDVLIQAVVPVFGEEALFGALAGLLKTARLEHSKLKCQTIGVEPQESAAWIVTRLKENAEAPDEREVRYVDGERQVPSWRELLSDSVAEVPWRDGGVYLITGGAGGLGLVFAEEIARRVKDAVVVLTGRSELDAGKLAQLSARAKSRWPDRVSPRGYG